MATVTPAEVAQALLLNAAGTVEEWRYDAIGALLAGLGLIVLGFALWWLK